MNTNDLPPAARLAALIEAGRAAYPNVGHGKGSYYFHGLACALGFAALGAGAKPSDLEASPIGSQVAFEKFTGLEFRWTGLCGEVACANDDGATLDYICHSLREGRLAEIPQVV